jgi:hypothetical protein
VHVSSMEDAKWKGLGLLGIIGLVLLIGAYKMMFSSGVVHLLIPLGRTVELEVDGQRATHASSGVGGGDGHSGTHVSYVISRGAHRIRLLDSDGTSYGYEVTIKNGFDELVLPIDANQCFMSLNFYPGLKPTVTEWHVDHQPVPVSDSIYVGADSIPARIPSGVIAIEPVACAEANQAR